MNWRGYNLSRTWQITLGGVEEWIGGPGMHVCVCVCVWSGTEAIKWYAASRLSRWKVEHIWITALFLMRWRFDHTRSQITIRPCTVQTRVRVCARKCVCVICILCVCLLRCVYLHYCVRGRQHPKYPSGFLSGEPGAAITSMLAYKARNACCSLWTTECCELNPVCLCFSSSPNSQNILDI